MRLIADLHTHTLVSGHAYGTIREMAMEAKEQQFIDKLDYGIAGIHRQCYEDAGIVKNTENLINCIKNPKIRFVSHPDDDHTPLDYKELVQAAKEYDIALEINNSSLMKVRNFLLKD